MQTLVLGGTAWLGGHVASAALEREHQVTCLARGFAGAVPEGVELVRADRSRPAAYDALTPAVGRSGRRRAAAGTGKGRGAGAGGPGGRVYLRFLLQCIRRPPHPGADEEARLLPTLTGEVMES